MSARRKNTQEPVPAVETTDTDISNAVEERPKRLCSEIQLFDLCSKSRCDTKDGRFCTDEKLLSRFEAISDEEDTVPDQYEVQESDEDVDEESSAYGDDLDDLDDYDDDYDEEP